MFIFTKSSSSNVKTEKLLKEFEYAIKIPEEDWDNYCEQKINLTTILEEWFGDDFDYGVDDNEVEIIVNNISIDKYHEFTNKINIFCNNEVTTPKNNNVYVYHTDIEKYNSSLYVYYDDKKSEMFINFFKY